MAWPSSSGCGSGAGSTPASLLHDDRKACAGLTEVLPELLRLDGRFGTRAGLEEARLDFKLESLLNGLVISPLVGDAMECSTVTPSGIVCGDTISLLRMLSELLIMSLLARGDVAGESLMTSPMGDAMNVDGRDAARVGVVVMLGSFCVSISFAGVAGTAGFICE